MAVDDGTADRPAAPPPPGDTVRRTLPACPYCGGRLTELADRCPTCGGALQALVQVIGMADAYFNMAVAAAGRRAWWEAAEYLAVTLALCPDDVDALVLQGKVRRRGKQRAAAESAFRQAMLLAPDRADVEVLAKPRTKRGS